MKKLLTLAALVGLAAAPMTASPAEAKGCIKGALVGGIAGHLAGHGVAGAAAGCAIGHHYAHRADRRARDVQPQGYNGGYSNSGVNRY